MVYKVKTKEHDDNLGGSECEICWLIRSFHDGGS